MYGYIYLTTNLISNKIYVGQHKSEIFEPNKYIGSGVKLQEAIKKYGWENFKNELICWCETQEELDKKEIYYIEFYKATNTDTGYNIAIGGHSGTTTLGWKWINNGISSKQINPEELDKFISEGWALGRLDVAFAGWNKGQTKETSLSLKKYGEERSAKFLSGELVWPKGKDSFNYKSNEELLQQIGNIEEFINFWWENGRCKAAQKYKMRTELIDRVLTILNLSETKEHKSYIYKKARNNRK